MGRVMERGRLESKVVLLFFFLPSQIISKKFLKSDGRKTGVSWNNLDLKVFRLEKV